MASSSVPLTVTALLGRQTNSSTDTSNLPHDDLGPQLNFTIWLLTALSLGFLGLRLYCKFLRGRGLWWDDHVLIAAWVSSPPRTARRLPPGIPVG